MYTSNFTEDPYWWGEAPRPVSHEASLPARADVVVIGSGLAGLNAALELSRCGREVAVLDASDIGSGASSLNMGFPLADQAWGPPLYSRDLARRHEALEIHRQGHEALAYLTDRIASEPIACEHSCPGVAVLAARPAHYEKLARLLDVEARELGGTGYMVSRKELAAEVGGATSEIYYGALIRPTGALLHPGLLVNGFFELASRAGVRFFPRAAAIRVERNKRGILVATVRGDIATRNVVVATGAEAAQGATFLRRRIFPVPAHVIVTEPMDHQRVKRLLPGLRGAVDTKNVIYNFRPSPDGRRVLFSADHGRDVCGRRQAARIRTHMLRVFPDLSDVGISHCWKGLVAMTLDQAPHVGEVDGVHYAVGWNGTGVTMASYMGWKLARAIVGSPQGCTVFDGRRFPKIPLYRGRPGRPWLLAPLRAAFNIADRLGFGGHL